MSEQATKSSRPVSLLAEFLEQMETIQDPLMLFEQTCRFLPRLTEINFASLLMFELPSGHPVHKNIYGNDRNPSQWPRLFFCQQIDETVLQHGVVLTCDPQQGNGFWLLLDEADGRWQGCELHLPLFWDHDRLVLLSLGKKISGADFTAEELDVLRILSCQLARWSTVLPMAEKNRINHRSRWLPMRGREAYAEIIGASPAIREIKKIIGQIAATDASVLITGESGTGKELLARAIHRSSLRGEKPMVVMNCASIPETLIESELFGHEKGAFTGAVCRRKGKFEFAHESTLFLDEIGDMSLAAQAKLLRVLQDGIFQRVGGESSLQANVRLISATNQSIPELIRQNRFREDLFFRINLVQIEIPPLRQRSMDVPVLIDFFLSQFNEKYHLGLQRINQTLYDFLLHYDFPGNVRELRTLVERAVIFHNNPDAIHRMIPVLPAEQKRPALLLTELEKEHIQAVLSQANYNKSEAARRLGIARKTLREKMSRYSLH